MKNICFYVNWFGKESSEMIEGNEIVRGILKGSFTISSTNLILYYTLPAESIAEITLKFSNLSLILSVSFYFVIFTGLYYNSIYNDFKDFKNTLIANLFLLGLGCYYILPQIYP